LERIEAENAHELTPERLAALEAAAADDEALGDEPAPSAEPTLGPLDEAPARLDEDVSPVAGRRLTRA
ncbi:MAG: 4-hydroxy-3-methylbut-2-en-1-yl diphosphate synthase, partial [Actinomycetota bacterium]|nr:4-hydroxy-3-methylbut-2-en-1-yl diphosphate synthase [Actinomycetota bacterium]